MNQTQGISSGNNAKRIFTTYYHNNVVLFVCSILLSGYSVDSYFGQSERFHLQESFRLKFALQAGVKNKSLLPLHVGQKMDDPETQK